MSADAELAARSNAAYYEDSDGWGFSHQRDAYRAGFERAAQEAAAEIAALRDKVARVEALADACDVKANRIPATVFSITGAIREALA